jgi:hypothetical protein
MGSSCFREDAIDDESKPSIAAMLELSLIGLWMQCVFSADVPVKRKLNHRQGCLEVKMVVDMQQRAAVSAFPVRRGWLQGKRYGGVIVSLSSSPSNQTRLTDASVDVRQCRVRRRRCWRSALFEIIVPNVATRCRPQRHVHLISAQMLNEYIRMPTMPSPRACYHRPTPLNYPRRYDVRRSSASCPPAAARLTES